VLFAFEETPMFKRMDAARLLRFVEVVHVQLPDERRKVAVLKELRQDQVCEIAQFLDLKLFAAFRPGNNIVVFLIVYDLKCFQQERRNVVNSVVLVFKIISGAYTLAAFFIILAHGRAFAA
jgi:hypothetical protein